MTAPTHKLATRRIRLDRLQPYYRNPRRGNVAAIAESLAAVGQYKPIVVNAGTQTGRELEVLAGNHTLQAAAELGWPSLLCVTVDVGEEQAARIVAADNRTSDLGTYDEADLLALLESLPDLVGTGYEDDDVAALVAATRPAVSLTDPDDAPTFDETPSVSTPGDVWALGPHRLVVGDALDPAVWDVLLEGQLVDAVWTDPPYGVDYKGGTKKREEISNDALSVEDLTKFLLATLGAARDHCRPGAAWYVTAPHGPIGLAFSVALAQLDVWRHSLVWVKNNSTFGRADYHYRHEPIYYGWKPGAARLVPVADRKQDTVWEYDRPPTSDEHPMMKPVGLVVRALQNSLPPGGTVLDCFAGAGVTLIGAHQVGAIARLVELKPRYADVICRRWQQHTGELPVRAGVPVDFVLEEVA